MQPRKIAIKGPQGTGSVSQWWPMPEPQEEYEEEGGHVDIVDGNFTQDPFELRAPETDHTPNYMKGPKVSKPSYGKFGGKP